MEHIFFPFLLSGISLTQRDPQMCWWTKGSMFQRLAVIYTVKHEAELGKIFVSSIFRPNQTNVHKPLNGYYSDMFFPLRKV